MKISIITVSYNAEKTIEQTILSVINQTYSNIEYIIIDGYSSDNTVDIIKKYQDLIAYWISEEDSGIYNAMNKGINLATGDYIQFLGSDDSLVSNDIIEKIVYNIKKYKYPDVLSTPVWAVEEKSRYERLMNNNISLENIKKGMMLPHQGIFLKTSIMKEYKFNEVYKISSDFELILKCVVNNKRFTFIDIPTVFFSIGGVSSNNLLLGRKESYKILRDVISNNVAEKFKRDFFKVKLKNLLYKIKNINYVKYKILGKKHICNNKYCRWCNSNKNNN